MKLLVTLITLSASLFAAEKPNIIVVVADVAVVVWLLRPLTFSIL